MEEESPVASGDDLRWRMWRDRLVRGLAAHLPAELDEAEALAGVVLVHGLPPGMNEMAVQASLWSSPAATEGWVERVMQIVRAVRDGIRLEEEPELELEPMRGAQPTLDSVPVPVQGPASIVPSPEIVLTLVMERLRALSEVQRLLPQVEGSRHGLRTLRIAVSGESDESARLPLLLAEWLATRQRWEIHHQVLGGALATLRSSEWLLQYLRAPELQHD
jgi:hypothetical protein